MSGGVYLIDELLSALAAPPLEQIQKLVGVGVPPATTCMTGAARIQASGEYYQPDQDGFPAWIIPCMDQGETCDLLAFTSNEPGRWWTRLGEGAFVGGDALGDAVMDEPVRVFRTPLSWLRAGAPSDGLVVVDVDHKLARRVLADYPIIAEDIAHGDELERELTVVQRPRISVPRKAAA